MRGTLHHRRDWGGGSPPHSAQLISDSRVQDAPSAAERASVIAAFTLLFPAFILYQLGVRSGLLPQTLGGYGTAGAIATLPFVGFAILRQARRIGVYVSLTDLIFASYLLLFAVIAFLGVQRGAPGEITDSHFAYVFKFVVWYAVTRAYATLSGAGESAASVLLVVVIAVVLIASAGNGFLTSALVASTPGVADIDYQGSAMVLLVMVSFVAPRRHLVVRGALYLLSVLALLVLGARSEFVALFLFVGVVEWCLARSKTAILAIVGMVGLGTAGWISTLDLDSLDNRIFGLLRLASDESARVRRELLVDATRTVLARPTLGSYGSYAPGEYAHNIVSAWVDFGFLGFFLLLCLVILPVVGLGRRYRQDSTSAAHCQALGVAIVVAVLMLLAKSHTYQLLPVSLGLFTAYLHQRRVHTNLAVLPES